MATDRPALRLASAAGGWRYGVGPASLAGSFLGDPVIDTGAEDQLRTLLPATLPEPQTQRGHHRAVDRLLYWCSVAMHAARLPVFMSGRQLDRDVRTGRIRLVLPSLPGNHEPTRMAVGWSMRSLFGGIEEPERDTLTKALLEALAPAAADDRNTWPFLQAAHRLDIPWQVMDRRFVQYGWGNRQRMLNSTFTDRTSAVAAMAARDKRLANHLLRRAGLPVPDQVAAQTLEEALAGAEQLGYPVVLKPRSLDGGVGVAAGLHSEVELRRAFARLQGVTRQWLVEKHIAGEDHRLMTFQGQLIWAIVRHPAAVTGDGRSSVQALVAQLNADPRRGRHGTARLRWVDLDDEALELLSAQGLAPEAVPEAGRKVLLRRTANLNRGGTTAAVLDRLHPDNRELALQAAEALDLDIAGIDVLLPDTARSWRETGAGICEINGQPQLGGNLQQHLHGQMLQALLKAPARIPVLVLVGQRLPWLDALLSALKAGVGVVGMARADGAWLEGPHREAIGRHRSLRSATSALLAHRRCELLVVCLQHSQDAAEGMAFDRADAIAWFDSIGGADGLGDLHRQLQPADDTLQVCNGDVAACRDLLKNKAGSGLPGAPHQAWVDRLVAICARVSG